MRWFEARPSAVQRAWHHGFGRSVPMGPAVDASFGNGNRYIVGQVSLLYRSPSFVHVASTAGTAIDIENRAGCANKRPYHSLVTFSLWDQPNVQNLYLFKTCTLGVAGHSEPWETDYSSAAPSRVTHVAQCVVFGAVMADAAMLDTALEMDALGRVRDGDGRRA